VEDNVNAVGLHKQVVEICAADLNTERTVGVQRFLGSLKLDVNAGVGGLSICHHLDLAVGPIVIAVQRLQNEDTTFGKPLLEGGDRLVLDLTISVTPR